MMRSSSLLPSTLFSFSFMVNLIAFDIYVQNVECELQESRSSLAHGQGATDVCAREE